MAVHDGAPCLQSHCLRRSVLPAPRRHHRPLSAYIRPPEDAPGRTTTPGQQKDDVVFHDRCALDQTGNDARWSGVEPEVAGVRSSCGGGRARSSRPETTRGGARSGRKSPGSGARQGRTSRLLALIIANFVAFWLPWNVLSLVVEFDSTAVPVDLFRLLDLGLKVLAMAGSACVNPILYCWSNDSIRGELVASIRQCIPIDHPRTTSIVISF